MTGPTDTDRSGGDPAYYEALGRAIRVLRTERGLARKDLAEAAGISYPYLSEIETGKKRPSSKALFAVAEALEVRPAELLALSDRYGGRTSVDGSTLPIASTLSPRSIPSQPIPPESGSVSAAFGPPPPAVAGASESAESPGRGWRWFERRAGAPAQKAASSGMASPMAVRAAAAAPAGQLLRTQIGAPDDERRRLIDELGEAAERLSDDDLAALLGLARRLGR
jgi:transcriptional regulator with XRE-family HTH domain